ncbi:uncharacterized protein LOC129048411 isoform X1 [Pongo abelii]|uniref:uncharacterized protein LOC129048411 isoform X1 n=1 Tax=Pongo abelii TaxID=9601 RepID=UPI0023E84768|nr:uncharacterized protein LOC129048411 isoform X1 [Pongo abelii]
MDAQQQGNARHRDARQHGNARHTDARQHGNARHTDARQHGNPRHMDARQYVNTSQGRRAAREHISHGCRAAREHKSTWRQILEAGSPRSSQFRFWGGLILTDGRPLALLLHDVTKRLRTQHRKSWKFRENVQIVDFPLHLSNLRNPIISELRAAINSEMFGKATLISIHSTQRPFQWARHLSALLMCAAPVSLCFQQPVCEETL